MTSVNSFSPINMTNAYSSPIRRPMSRTATELSKSPLRQSYRELQDSTHHLMSPISPLPIRSSAAFGRSSDLTPRRVSPSTGYPRTPRGSICGTVFVGGPISPRYAISVQRRYQVISDNSALAVGARRAATPSGRVFPKTVCRGTTAPKAGCGSPVPNLQLAKTGARLSPTEPALQPHSALQQPQQPLPLAREQHTVGRPSHVVRGMRKDSGSFVASNKDSYSIEDASVNQPVEAKKGQRMSAPQHSYGGSGNIRRFNMIETHPSRDPSCVAPETINAQQHQHVFPARCTISSSGRSSRQSLISPACQLPSMQKEVATETPKQFDMCSMYNQELPIHESSVEGALDKPLTPSGIHSPILSTPMNRCSTSDIMNKSHSRHETTTTTTNGSTPVHSSQDCSRSSTEGSNVKEEVAISGTCAPDRQIGVSFVSSRRLLRQFVLRWRNQCEENQNVYSEGGYMTVIPGKKLNSRYVIVQKLGWGEFSTVWLAYDTMHTIYGKPNQAFVAVKIAKCDTSVTESTQYEVNLIRYVGVQAPQDAPLTSLIDCFEVRGKYGLHVCMVMPLYGSNLLSIIDTMKANKRLRSPGEVRLIKEIIASVLVGLVELDNMNIIHTDIKPENILSSMPDPKVLEVIETFCHRNKERSAMVPHETINEPLSQGDPNHLVCLADFGLSLAMKPSDNVSIRCSDSADVSKRRVLLNTLLGSKKDMLMKVPGKVINLNGMLIQTREYRAPEVLIGLDFNSRSDIWSVGCMVYELITGDFLMDPKRQTKNERLMDIEHLAMMMQLLGPVPQEIVQLRNSTNQSRPPPRYIHRYFDECGRFMHAAKYHLHSRRRLDRELEQFLPPTEAKSAAHFILECLSCYDPALRPSAQEILGHKWLEEVMERP